MMLSRWFAALLVLPVLFSVGCGYRFVDPLPASGYALASVRNATAEPGLAPGLEEALRSSGAFKGTSARELSVVITRFHEGVASVSSSGTALRQELTMEVAWKVKGPEDGQNPGGEETVVRTYPYSADAVTLQWNRSAAVRLLVRSAAASVLERLGEKP